MQDPVTGLADMEHLSGWSLWLVDLAAGALQTQAVTDEPQSTIMQAAASKQDALPCFWGQRCPAPP
jgi:hypothetical protein